MTDCKLKLGQFLKTQKKRRGLTRVLIIENIQNCFFGKGSMAFMSKSSKEEKDFINKINKLINFTEKDEKYELSGKSGKEKKGKLNPLQRADFSTGARNKYYYDMVIFTQIANPPDHFSFDSHHFLNNPNIFKYFSSQDEGTKFITSKKKLKMSKKKKLYLLPDYALTDGADNYVNGGKVLKGIDFHPELDTSSLFRPNDKLNQNVFINAPRYYNRGYILTKGNDISNNHSAFYNSNKKSTGLSKFLRCNLVNSITVCGMGREEIVYNTLFDSLKSKYFKERILLHDATKPINIDLAKFKKKPKMVEQMRSDDIESNKFLERYKKNGIKILNTNNLFTLVENVDRKVNMNDMGRLGSIESAFEGTEVSVVNNSNINSLFNNRNNRNNRSKKKSRKKESNV